VGLNSLLSDGYDAATQSRAVTSKPYKYGILVLLVYVAIFVWKLIVLYV